MGRPELTPRGRWMAAVLVCGDRARPLALGAGFPMPLTKHRMLGYEVDFWFPDHGLIVETDGLRYHRTASQQARMAKRDQVHTASGLRVLRFTHWQIAHATDEVTGVLRRIRQLTSG